MKNKNIKVIDEHNIDRDANVMFAFELDGSEYVAYWISRDEESNNVFVSKVLKNNDNTNSMLNIDDEDKKKEIAEIVKTLVSSAVADQNDKMPGVTMSLSNGQTIKFVSVAFNKEQQINVTKTYITTVKKEVTKVAETYYDVVTEEEKIEPVLVATPVVENIPEVFPEIVAPTTAIPAVESSVVVPQPAVVETSVVAPAPVAVTPVIAPVSEAPVVVPQPAVVETPVVTPAPVAATPVIAPVSEAPVVVPQPAVVETPVVAPAPVAVAPVIAPVSEAPVVIPQPVAVETPVVAPTPVATATVTPIPVIVPVEETPNVIGTPVVEAPLPSEPLIFNASKETNLNAALGEVASSGSIPVENINSVREFGVEEIPLVASQPAIAPMIQPETTEISKTLTKKAGFANSKFFMVVAISFFLASCIFLGYEVFNYFQLVK